MDNTILDYFGKHPLISIISLLVSYLVTYIDEVTIFLKLTTLILAVVVSLLTIYSKHLEIKKLKKK